MTAAKGVSKLNRGSIFAEVLISLGLFLLAFLPRAYALQRFVTADEAKWVYRSAQFLAAFLNGDFAATSVNLTPAVTTTWLGSLGLALYYRFHQATLNLPFTGWLLSLPEFRTELDLLAATRWPMVIFTSLSVIAIYLPARRLFGPLPAFLGAVFIAFDPHTVALARVLGHDAPVTVFMTISLLLLLLALKPVDAPSNPEATSAPARSLRPVPGGPAQLFPVLSGIAAGLAFLSKAPALFLIPFAGLLFLSRVWGRSTTLYFWVKRFVLWLAVAYLTFIAFWPAAWLDPLERPLAVVENAFLSATDEDEAEAEGYWLVPDLGPLYYLVNGIFKLSPLVMAGTGLALWSLIQSCRQRPPPSLSPSQSPSGRNLPPVVTSFRSHPSTLLWLLLFVLLFTLFMTLGDKRSPRYILPAFPPLALIAAVGWVWLFEVVNSRWQQTRNRRPAGDEAARPQTGRSILFLLYGVILTFSAVIILLPYAPYYFTYYNPLVGGPYTARYLVKIGWGEGLDRVGRFLNREGNWSDSRVGTPYASTVAPFFGGDLAGVTSSNLDLVVLYIKQIQSGEPSPTFIRYFEQLGPVFSVNLNGIRYADLYPGPAVQKALTLTPGLDHVILPKPIGFRPLTPYGHIGEPLLVDVLWLADDRSLPADPSVLTLEPLSAFDFLEEHNHLDGTPEIPREITILAQGQAPLIRVDDKLVVSRHSITIPAELSRGTYALLVDGRPLGEIDLRHFQLPGEWGQVSDLVFGEQIALVGYQFEPTEDYIEVTIAWQAQKSRLPDYTVFVQLLDAETNRRITGVDTQPLKGEWPTSRWAREEVVVDTYTVAVPPDLPAGHYKIIAGLYRPQTGQRLTLPDGRDHWILPWTYIRNEHLRDE